MDVEINRKMQNVFAQDLHSLQEVARWKAGEVRVEDASEDSSLHPGTNLLPFTSLLIVSCGVSNLFFCLTTKLLFY